MGTGHVARSPHRHANVADAAVQQQGGQIRRGLAWCSARAGRHARGDALVGCHVIPDVEGLCTQ